MQEDVPQGLMTAQRMPGSRPGRFQLPAHPTGSALEATPRNVRAGARRTRGSPEAKTSEPAAGQPRRHRVPAPGGRAGQPDGRADPSLRSLPRAATCRVGLVAGTRRARSTQAIGQAKRPRTAPWTRADRVGSRQGCWRTRRGGGSWWVQAVASCRGLRVRCSA